MTEDVEVRPPQQKLTFKYPLLPRPIEVFCWVLMLVVFWVGYRGNTPLQGAFSLLSVSFLWLVMGSGGLVTWVLFLWLGFDRVTLDEKGIRAGRGLAAWEDITEITHPRLFGRRSSVLIRDSSPKPGFFDVRAAFSRRGRPARLMGFPVTYREVLPAVLAVRPDLDVPPLIRRLMDDPEQGMEPRWWLALPALGVTVALLAAAWAIHGRGMCAQLMIGVIMLGMTGTTRSLTGLWAKDARTGLLAMALSSPLLVGGATLLALFGMGSYPGLRALIATALALVFGATAVYFLTDRFRPRHQLALAALLLAVPVVAHVTWRSAEWPVVDLSGELEVLDSVTWGEDGVYATVWSCDDPPPLLHLPTRTLVPVPGHGGKATVHWLGKRYLLWSVEVGQNRELWAFNLKERKESRLPAAQQHRLGRLGPVDPGHRRVVWLDCDAARRARGLRIWDLAAGREERQPIPMPPEMWDAGCTADWTGADTIGVHGQDPVGRLLLLRVNVRTGETEASASADGYHYWIPVAGLNCAFGITQPGPLPTCSLTWVDLQTGRSVPLDGVGSYPAVAPEAGCSFRVRELEGERELCRFDFATGQEAAVCPLPAHLGLAGVSRSGRTVLLGPSDLLGGMPEYVVLDVLTGKRHLIRPTGMGMSCEVGLLVGAPNRLPLSPDGRRILLTTAGVGQEKVLLYTIPRDWP